MSLYGVARKIYHSLKKGRGAAPRVMSRVRRIDRVFPPPGDLVVAVTFDDGPTVAPAKPYSNQPITELILDILAEYDCFGTFDVIGSTSENYPDRCGKPGSVYWSGMRFDHYPEFGKDELAGVLTQKSLAKEIVARGHELSNHGFRHMAFGPKRIVYGSRSHFNSIDEVISDLRRLHDLVAESTGFCMRLGRPPHYVDAIPGGKSAYDAYEAVGYQYLGASFDGGCWMATRGSFEEEVKSAIKPLEDALRHDVRSLSGQIIFQKDGYNMSIEAPVVAALPRQLEILKSNGYRVVTVSQLLKMSRYSDLSPTDPSYEYVKYLEDRGYPVVYRDNTFRPKSPCLIGEYLTWIGQASRASSGTEVLTLEVLSKTVPASLLEDVAIGLPSDPVPRWVAAVVAARLHREAIDDGRA